MGLTCSRNTDNNNNMAEGTPTAEELSELIRLKLRELKPMKKELIDSERKEIGRILELWKKENKTTHRGGLLSAAENIVANSDTFVATMMEESLNSDRKKYGLCFLETVGRWMQNNQEYFEIMVRLDGDGFMDDDDAPSNGSDDACWNDGSPV